MASQISIYSYLNYRQYLADLIDIKKSENSKYTHRYLSEQGGFGLGLLTKILNGERNISAKIIVKLMDLFEMDANEQIYFEAMVNFNQAHVHSEKAIYLKQIMELKQHIVRSVDVCQYEFYNEWYFAVIRELLGIINFNGDYRALAELVSPSITVRQARRAVKVLRELEMVNDVDGFLKPATSQISTGYETTSTAINNYIITTMEKAKEVIDYLPADEKNMSTICMSINNENRSIIIEKLRTFRRELMAFAESDEKASRVFQLNMQFFSLSNVSEEEK